MILILDLDLDGGWFQYNPLLHIVMKVKTKNRHPSKIYWKLDRQADVRLQSWYCVKAGQGEKRAFFVACKSIYVLVTEMDTRHKKSLRGNRQRGKNGLFCVLKSNFVVFSEWWSRDKKLLTVRNQIRKKKAHNVCHTLNPFCQKHFFLYMVCPETVT